MIFEVVRVGPTTYDWAIRNTITGGSIQGLTRWEARQVLGFISVGIRP